MLSRLRTLRLVHHHPGRLRVRAEEFLDHAPAADAVRSALAAVPSVRQIVHNESTGSLLVEYVPGDVEPDELVSLVARAARLNRIQDETTPHADPDDPVRHVIDGARTVNALIAQATGHRVDLRMLVPSGMLAAGVYSLLKRPTLPRWENLFVWSFQLFVTLNQEEVRAGAGHR